VTAGRMESDMNNKKIGEYISTRRKNNQLTQKELADKLGVTDKAVSKWERGAGYPDISMLKPLSDILGVTVNELLEGEDCKNIQEDLSEDNESEGNSVSKVLE
jgi:transcriptional regulator with XRE-family HTH domain